MGGIDTALKVAESFQREGGADGDPHVLQSLPLPSPVAGQVAVKTRTAWRGILPRGRIEKNRITLGDSGGGGECGRAQRQRLKSNHGGAGDDCRMRPA